MLTSLQVTVQPAEEPTTVMLLKQHCRIDTTADDTLLAGYLTAARMMAEGYLSRALVTQTVLWTVRPDPTVHSRHSRLWHALELPRAPIQSIASVTVVDDWGNSTVVPAATLPITPYTQWTGYLADLSLTPARLTISPDTVLTGNTTLRYTRLQHVQVSMVAGYGAAATVPQTIVQAIMMTAAFLYEHRGDAGGELPQAAQWLLDRDRLQFLGG